MSAGFKIPPIHVDDDRSSLDPFGVLLVQNQNRQNRLRWEDFDQQEHTNQSPPFASGGQIAPEAQTDDLKMSIIEKFVLAAAAMATMVILHKSMKKRR